MKITIPMLMLFLCSQLMASDFGFSGSHGIDNTIQMHDMGMNRGSIYYPTEARELGTDGNYGVYLMEPSMRDDLKARFNYHVIGSDEAILDLTEFNVDHSYPSVNPRAILENGFPTLRDEKLTIPKSIPADKRNEIINLVGKLKRMCPECSQAPVIPTENPIITTTPTSTHGISPNRGVISYVPKCEKGKVFNSRLGICVTRDSEERVLNVPDKETGCSIPNWLLGKISILEKVAKHHSVKLVESDKECRKRYVVELMVAIKGALNP